MTATFAPLRGVDRGDRRRSRDRLELLTALLNAPNVEPFYRDDVIYYPDQHRVFAWRCSVAACTAPRTGHKDMCHGHIDEWARLKADGGSRFEFARTANASASTIVLAPTPCRICLHRPTSRHSKELCDRHTSRWHAYLRAGGSKAGLQRWMVDEVAYPSYGRCRVAVCSDLAASPLRLCSDHRIAYNRARRPGAATLLRGWSTWSSPGDSWSRSPTRHCSTGGARP